MQVTIDGRYNGPDGSANGGYACGLIAHDIEGPITVRLRAKPPLDKPMDLRAVEQGAGYGVELYDGETLVALTREGGPDRSAVPTAPTLQQAREAQRNYTGFHTHSFPRCFVCGPKRDEGDGLRLFPGPIGEQDLAACVWEPSSGFCESGQARREYIWAALDCPSFFGLRVPYDRIFLLAEMSASLLDPIAQDEPVIVYGWGRKIEGRKYFAGSAIASTTGEILAHAEHLWIEARPT